MEYNETILKLQQRFEDGHMTFPAFKQAMWILRDANQTGAYKLPSHLILSI